MRKSIAFTLILLFLVTCMVCIAKFEDKNYIIDTQESKDILKTDEKFDCDAKECIDILNVDIKKENLRTIPNHCIQEKISESIEVDGIPTIILTRNGKVKQFDFYDITADNFVSKFNRFSQ